MRLATSFVFRCRCLLVVLILMATIRPAMGQANVTGKWTTLSYTMPINPVHAALLHTGKILIVSGSGSCPPTLSGCPSGPPYGPANKSGAALLDTKAGTITQYTLPWDMFCNAMIVLPDGRPFILGGTESYDSGGIFTGLPYTATYDPATGIFSGGQAMAHGRWYPTAIVLGDGRVMVLSGAISGQDHHDQSLTLGNVNRTVEFYTVGSGWSQEYTVPTAWTKLPLYPRLHILPSGKVFYSAPEPTSALFDPSNQTWTLDVATTIFGDSRGYGTSVLLPLTPENKDHPHVMIFGGGGFTKGTTATTEIIDLGASTLAWESGPDMSQPRIEMNATILPNGKVLAMGGSLNDEDLGTASKNADLYDPALNTFSSAGVNAYAHLYHSVSLLLPDATVWFAGGNPRQGNYEPHMEIYQPAYLFNPDGTLATRPTISSAPTSISYNSQFTVDTPDAANISSVVLMRNGAVTHAFNMDQRMVGMSFAAGSESLTVTTPSNDMAPPGYYMLFLVNNQGVPSVASMVQVPSGTPPPPPPSGISFVQGNSATSTSSSSLPIPYLNGQIAGDLNAVAVMWGDTTSTVSSVTDSKGNTYTRAAGPTPNTGLQQSIYYAKNIAGGSNTVTVKFNQAASYPNVNVLEYSGLDTTNPLDVSHALSGSGTTASSGSATTTSANELIFGAGNTAHHFTAPGSESSNRIINGFGGISEDQIVNGIGSYAATATNSAGAWVMQMAAFRGSRQSSSSPPVPTAVSPTSGTASGGTPITITGTGFSAGASVSLGGTAATNVTVVSSASITATTPAHAAGTVNVVVTNGNGQSGTLSNGYTYTSSGAINFVQVASGPPTIQASNTSVAVLYPSAQTAGNLNIVAVGWGDTTSSISSVTDSKGNTYTRAVGPTTNTGLQHSIYYAKNIAGGSSNTVTVKFNQAAAYPDVRILEYSGLDPTSPLNVTAAAAGNGTSASSGSASTTSANVLIFGAGNTAHHYTIAGSGFTTRVINIYGSIAEDNFVSSTGSYAATATNSAGLWVMQMATFKAKP
jgi:hypothetical protein